jgi:outer membrane protein OmpA-like peptidoglycan-associated protein
MQLRSALLAATLLATPIVASAQPVTGLYVGVGAGTNYTQQERITGVSVGVPAVLANPVFANTNGDFKSSWGFAGVVSMGYGFGNGLRAEIEGDYRNNHIGGFTNSNFNGFGGISGGTTEQKYGGMFNVLYDFNGLTPWFVPYVGLGAGYAWNNEKWHAYNTFTITEPACIFGPAVGARTFLPGAATSAGKSTEGSFAYQAILGAAIPLPQIMPGLAATVEYRFFGTAGSNRSYGGTSTAVSTSTVAPVAFTNPTAIRLGNSYNHSILVGLRYNFGVAPPPPPPPAPPPVAAPARSYLVFFDWDKATLTDRARQIVREAADNSTKVQYTRIEVNGYTDTSGTPRYNRGLSIRRARAVQAELIKDGVPAGAITIQGFGETHLLVPTGPGVREPQNRRVEIIIR